MLQDFTTKLKSNIENIKQVQQTINLTKKQNTIKINKSSNMNKQLNKNTLLPIQESDEMNIE